MRKFLRNPAVIHPLSYGMFMQSKTISDILNDAFDQHTSCHLADSIKHLTIQVRGEDKLYKFDGFGPMCRETRLGDEFEDFNLNPNLPVVVTTAKADGGRGGRGGGRGRGRGGGKKMFPADMCRLIAGQRPKFISADDKVQLIRASAEAAPIRQAKIQEIVENEELFDSDMLSAFGIQVDKKAMDAQGLVLPMPNIIANGGDAVELKKSKEDCNGTWDINTFNRAASAKIWGRIVLGNDVRDRRTWEDFCKMFVTVGKRLGVDISEVPVMDIKIKNGFEYDAIVSEYESRGQSVGSLPFVLVCVPDYGNDYEIVKTISELNNGILTQMVKARNVNRPDEAMLKNLWYKLNTKLGGENWRIDVPLPDFPVPIMIVGVSISYPEPKSTDPSLVGFVGSTAQGGTQYVNTVVHQDPRLAIIHYKTFKAALRFLIGQFINENNGAKPEKIIFYRGGASEDATQAILKNELADGIRKALMEIDDTYKPGITFICSIRGSKQKYFCKDEKDMNGIGQNIPAGTVVAGYGNGVPESYSFHLASQAACGTVNPTFYQVIHDDNEIEIQNCSEMTYALSLATMRSNRATSECAPVRLASLVAERARAHWNGSKTIENEGPSQRPCPLCENMPKMRNYFINHERRIKVRGKFQESTFFI
ncbi:unnamed protein product [Oikopleura dioica]|uniref:Piwi domain-containing protein n=1 Tax=Oikopleura dioica TaxID=34765 RepID=E4Y8N3_OIKDI|nr:unnamed protein product [Oikopleura dioica]